MPNVYVVLAGIRILSLLATRSARVSAGVAVRMILVGVIDIGTAAMATIALVPAATFLAVVPGIPVGVAMSRSTRFLSVMLPVLDILQTMPILVYFIPFVMLFGPGKVTAQPATILPLFHLSCNSLMWLVTPEGFEPSTYGLEVRRSSIELWGLRGHRNTGPNASSPPDGHTKNWIRIRALG